MSSNPCSWHEFAQRLAPNGAVSFSRGCKPTERFVIQTCSRVAAASIELAVAAPRLDMRRAFRSVGGFLGNWHEFAERLAPNGAVSCSREFQPMQLA